MKRPRSSRITPLLVKAIVLFSSSTTSALKDVHAAALSPSLVSSGLKNLGNTCYMNAQLQCAFHIPLLRKLALESVLPEKSSFENENASMDDADNLDQGESSSESEPVKESSAKVALRELFSEMIVSSTAGQQAIAPRNFCMRLGIPPMVQQDSQEFWKLFLPALELEKITDLYKGSFESYITALDGSNRERRREEVFLDLSLDVGKSRTLLDSLSESFGEPELLSEAEGNGWRPEKGADKVDAHKGSSLIAHGLPPILQFHLKRFTYDWQTDNMHKVNDRLVFPSEINLSSLCKPVGKEASEDSTLYDLQSVVVHVGRYGMGHYYAYVRPDPEQDTWYRFNDDVVEEVTEEDVFADAYGGKNNIRNSRREREKRGIPMLGRLLRRIGGNGGGNPYGFGGCESNAYVVQYVRRSDRSMLYLK